MPFDQDLQEVYDHAIFPAADAAGFECYRADYATAPRAIIAGIIRFIFRADAIVADLTHSEPKRLLRTWCRAFSWKQNGYDL